MDPSEHPSLADLIMSRGNATVLEHNGIRIVSAIPLPPIKTNKDNITLLQHNWNADMALSGMNGERASIRFGSTNLIDATFEIRDINISILGKTLLRSCNLTLINCHINASRTASDRIDVCGGSHLKLVGCEVNNCRITDEYGKFKSRRKTYEFLNCNFSYTDPLAVFYFLDTTHSDVILNECRLPRLKATNSSTVEARGCIFKQIELTEASSGEFTNCKLEGEIPGKAVNSNNVILMTKSTGRFINCPIRWLYAYQDSEAFVTDSIIECALVGYSSQIKMKNSTIKSKARYTIITAQSTLEAHNLTIQRVPITAGENLYERLPAFKITSSRVQFTGNFKFAFEEDISRTRLDMYIDESTVLFPKTINANLFPRLFETGSRVFYPEGFRVNVSGSEGNEFHKILMGSLFPGDSKTMYTSQRAPLLFGKRGEKLRLNYHLLHGSSVTLDDMFENEIVFAKSLIPSRAFLASKGVKISRELMNDRTFFTNLFLRIYPDICPVCHEDEKPCDIVVSCGHVYHEKCYQSMVSHAKQNNCALCRKTTFIVNIYKQ
jgi:hypothetical protein